MDSFINYYVTFLIEHQIPFSTGFFMWHTIVFICVLLLMFFTAILIKLVENRKIFAKNKENIGIGMGGSAFASVMFLWFLTPFSALFLPIKTEVGVVLFIVGIFISAVLLFLARENNFVEFLNHLHNFTKFLVPLIVSVFGVIILAGSLSLADIAGIQGGNGIFSWFCLPLILSLPLVFYSLVLIFSEFSEEKYFLIEKMFLFSICIFVVALFFGGYMPPAKIFIADFFDNFDFLQKFVLCAEQTFWLFAKSLFLYYFVGKIADYTKFQNFVKKNFVWLTVLNFVIVCIFSSKFGGYYVF